MSATHYEWQSFFIASGFEIQKRPAKNGALNYDIQKAVKEMIKYIDILVKLCYNNKIK